MMVWIIQFINSPFITFEVFRFQDPNADTEWNDILRQKGILAPKQETEVTEDDILSMVEQTIDRKTNGKPLNTFVLLYLYHGR